MAVESDNSVTTTPSPYACFDDPLYLNNNEQTSLSLVAKKFDGTKFLSWKREAYLTLIAKNKEEIKETVDYSTSAREIWSDLLERYGQMNNVEIYQLRKELSGISQANAPIVEYYSKLKRTWETLDSVDPIPMCTCGALTSCTCQLLKRLFARETQTKLIQFLMGLNGGFENVKTNVLSMEPLPPLNKAYALLQQVEKQKQVIDVVDVLAEANAYASASARQSDHKQGNWKKAKVDDAPSEPAAKFCTNCKKEGLSIILNSKLLHFKLPHFFHSKRGAAIHRPSNTYFQNGRNVYRRGAHNANVIQEEYSPLDLPDDGFQPLAPVNSSDIPSSSSPNPLTSTSASGAFTSTPALDSDLVQEIVHSVYQQVMRAIPEHSANATLNFAGILPMSHVNTVNIHHNMHTWIVNTSVSDHMTSNEHFLHDIRLLSHPVHIGLPDGNIKIVHKAGNMRLNAHIRLHNVLIVPDFKENLLSIGKLLKTSDE
ncbi:uncharacterized protein LOC141588422 [Silene latifolia]|uniref:uncharacterized protein LOC141588422 n=1 Tax=Silene latifolia TaxID=37657 RepID=UPI003D7872F0